MLHTLRILVVDDLETMCKVTAGQLHSLGVGHVEIARNGVEALRLLRAKRFNLVATDLNMPVMDGLELLSTMRAEPGLADLPVIMITAEAERARIEQAIAQGVNDLLVKPYSAARLAQGIERALRRQRVRAPKIDPPSATRSTPEGAEATRLASAATPATLLLVDDTPDNLHLLAHLFKGSYRVRFASNGEKALEICRSDQPPHLVLLDVMMPGIDGFEVARRMREHPNTENTPIIFVTSLDDEASRLKGMTLGAIDFVSKPIEADQLKLRVDNFMRYVELRRQLQADYDNQLEIARLRDEVDAMTRHDLKGPLSAAIGMIRGLVDASDLSNRQTEQLQMAEQSLLHVINMVNMSSELYKIETEQFQLQAKAVPLGQLLRGIASVARHAFAAKQLVVSVDADVDVGADLPCALGDETLCYSLLTNLVRNACEAAPEHSRVSIALQPGDPQRIVIGNEGEIPEAIRERFFDKFVTHGKATGSGLGAYSARLLARAQGGDVEFEVADGKTTLLVSLPKADSPKKA